MSWPWSAPPPQEEPLEAPSSDFSTFSESPTADFSTSFSGPSSDFGTAFTDDLPPPDHQPPLDQTFSTHFSSSSAYDSTAIPSSDATSASDPSLNLSSLSRIDPTLLSPRAHLRTPSPDYVFADDYKEHRKKSGAEQLTYLAGSSYLLGGTLGGTAGAISALRASADKSHRLRINAVLNASGKRGAALANALGVLALAFSLSESMLFNYSSDDSLVNYAAAGAVAGGLYRSTRGARLAGIWALGGAGVAVASIYASRRGYYGTGLQGIL